MSLFYLTSLLHLNCKSVGKINLGNDQHYFFLLRIVNVGIKNFGGNIMSTLGNIFVLLGLVGSVWGIIRLLRQRKHPLTKRLNLIMLIGGIILVIVGSPMANTKAASCLLYTSPSPRD